MMKLPFTAEQTGQVRKDYCARVAQENLKKALESVLREV